MTSLWYDDGEGWRLLPSAGYPDEAALHDCVEQAPELLPLSGSPSLVVVGREVPLGSGYADLVAIEPDGRIGLIEVKLARNSEARRAVIAQILAYAAALHGADVESVERDILGSELRKRGFASLAEAAVTGEQGGDLDHEAFNQSLADCLATGGFRLVLVLDEAPGDLVRLVGYLEAVTRHLVIDLVTVASYEVGGSRVVVPRRVEPDREASRVATRASGTALTTPSPVVEGAEAFRSSIEEAPPEHRAALMRLHDWAVSLEQEKLARLSTKFDKRGSKVLRIRVPGTSGGIATAWNDGAPALQVWRSVLELRAPRALASVEAHTGPLGSYLYTRDFDDDLLRALTEAYREASARR
jgi:hypothetical protein